MPVAKSYQNLEICGSPYKKNGRDYVVVACANGHRKEVRWYSDAEYNRMYPEAKVEPIKRRSLKEVLGFKEGYITIVKGKVFELLDWLKFSPARYHVFFGWYFVSEEEMPELPAGLEPVKIYWEQVAHLDQDCLRSEGEVRALVEKLIYEPSNSRYYGSVGERVELELTVKKAIESDGYYGRSTFHVLESAEENIFTWNTGAKQLEVGETYKLRGTVKEHITYKGEEQTVLTRCTILN